MRCGNQLQSTYLKECFQGGGCSDSIHCIRKGVLMSLAAELYNPWCFRGGGEVVGQGICVGIGMGGMLYLGRSNEKLARPDPRC